MRTNSKNMGSNEVENLKKLCAQRGVSIRQLEQTLGYSNGSIASAGSIKASRLYQISRYFGVPMDYFITGVSESASGSAGGMLTEEELQYLTKPEIRTLLEASRDVSSDDVIAVADILNRLKTN